MCLVVTERVFAHRNDRRPPQGSQIDPRHAVMAKVMSACCGGARDDRSVGPTTIPCSPWIWLAIGVMMA